MMIAMRTVLPLLLLVSLVSTSFAQGKPERAMNLGYTPAQIVAMGEEKFGALFDKKYGSSTAAMIDFQISYAWAVEVESNKLLASQPKATQGVLKAAKADMKKAGEHSSQIQAAFSGGGTMYNIFYVAAATRAETTIFDILKRKSGKTATLSTVESKYQKVKALVAKSEESLAENEAMSNIKLSEVKTMLEEMHQASTRTAAAIKGLTTGQQGMILLVFADAFDNILIENTGE